MYSTKYRLQNQNPCECAVYRVLLCPRASAHGSKLNYSEAFKRTFPTKQWDNTVYKCQAAGLLLRLKWHIYHFLSNVLYTWTQSSALQYRASAPVNYPTSAVAGRSHSQNSIYKVKRGPITSLQCECDRIADEPREEKVTKPTVSNAWTAKTSLSFHHWFSFLFFL